MFTNSSGDWGSIPGQVIPKTKKNVLDASLLNTQHYKVQIKGKWNNPGKEVALFPSYSKESLWVALDYSQLREDMYLYKRVAFVLVCMCKLITLKRDVFEH